MKDLTTIEEPLPVITVEDELGYEYPDGLDLRPDSDLHGRIVTTILQRAKLAKESMQSRYDEWQLVDQTMQAFIPKDDAEKLLQKKDPRKPVSMVLPLSYSVHETLTTYLVGALIGDPTLKLDPFSPEDAYAVTLLERLLQYQVKKGKMALNLHTQFSDGLKYGIGIASPIWTVEEGMVPTPGSRGFDRSVTYEGHILENVNVYNYLPDPNVAAHDIQKGEFVGWTTRENRLDLLDMERQFPDAFFNVKYLKDIDGRSMILKDYIAYREADLEPYILDKEIGYGNAVDVVYMYIKIIPKEWGLGDSEYPEKWMFAVAADTIVIAASPIGLAHDKFPVTVCSPNFDGYSAIPTSNMELIRGMQQAVDWFFSARVTNVRKAINDMLVVDPKRVNIADLKRPDKAGGIIRLRHSAWGQGVQNAVDQLKVQDVTAGHVGDIAFLSDIIQRVSGATDALQGIQRNGPERVSANEARTRDTNAASRLMKMARMVAIQCLDDLAYMMATQTQQFLTEETYVRLIGRQGEDLAATYGQKYARVTPYDIQVPFDVVASDGTTVTGEYADTWVQLFGMIASQPEIAQQFDLVRIFRHIARLTGVKNLEDFTRQGGMMQPQVMPDQQVMDQAASGQLVPFQGVANAAGLG